jgi:hypothetical protein
MTFRHPLRNDWDAFKRELEPVKLAPTVEGATARAMLAIMPAYLDYIEDVRDRAENPHHVLIALTALTSNLITQTIKQKVKGDGRQQREALRVVLSEIERGAKARMSTRGPVMSGGIIIPGL